MNSQQLSLIIQFLQSGDQGQISESYQLLQQAKENFTLTDAIAEFLNIQDLKINQIFICLSIIFNYDIVIDPNILFYYLTRNSDLINNELSKIIAKYIHLEHNVLDLLMDLGENYPMFVLNTLSNINFEEVFSPNVTSFLVGNIFENADYTIQLKSSELFNLLPEKFYYSGIHNTIEEIFSRELTFRNLPIISNIVGLAGELFDEELLFDMLLSIAEPISRDGPLPMELQKPMRDIIYALNQAFRAREFDYEMHSYIHCCVMLCIASDEQLALWSEDINSYLDLYDDLDDLRALCLEALMYKQEHIEMTIEMCENLINDSVNEQEACLWILYNIAGKMSLPYIEIELDENVLCQANYILFQMLNSKYTYPFVETLQVYLETGNFVFIIAIANELININDFQTNYHQLIPTTIQALSSLINEDDTCTLNILVTINLLIAASVDSMAEHILDFSQFLNELMQNYAGNYVIFQEIVSIISTLGVKQEYRAVFLENFTEVAMNLMANQALASLGYDLTVGLICDDLNMETQYHIDLMNGFVQSLQNFPVDNETVSFAIKIASFFVKKGQLDAFAGWLQSVVESEQLDNDSIKYFGSIWILYLRDYPIEYNSHLLQTILNRIGDAPTNNSFVQCVFITLLQFVSENQEKLLQILRSFNMSIESLLQLIVTFLGSHTFVGWFDDKIIIYALMNFRNLCVNKDDSDPIIHTVLSYFIRVAYTHIESFKNAAEVSDLSCAFCDEDNFKVTNPLAGMNIIEFMQKFILQTELPEQSIGLLTKIHTDLVDYYTTYIAKE